MPSMPGIAGVLTRYNGTRIRSRQPKLARKLDLTEKKIPFSHFVGNDRKRKITSPGYRKCTENKILLPFVFLQPTAQHVSYSHDVGVVQVRQDL